MNTRISSINNINHINDIHYFDDIQIFDVLKNIENKKSLIIKKLIIMKNLIALFIIVWTIVVSIEWYPKCGVVLGVLFPITISVGAIYILYFIKK